MRIDLESMTSDKYEQYRAFCDSRSSAEYRYRREACGIEIAEIADDLGVRLDTAKRWENPRKGLQPSLRAWAYVDSAYLDMLDAVESVIQDAEDAAETPGGYRPARIEYRRGNMEAGGMTVGRANALSRASAVALTVLGYDVDVVWAD